MGDDYAECLAASLATFDMTKSLKMGHNRLSNKGALALFRTVNNRLETLDISYNPGIEVLSYDYSTHNILSDNHKR